MANIGPTPWPHGKEKLGSKCKAKGLQIISIICDTRDISGIPGSYMDRVGEFGSGGTQEGTKSVARPYLTAYIEFESTRRLDGSAGITRFAIEARAVFWVAPTYLFDQMPVLVTAYPWICSEWWSRSSLQQ